MADRDYQPITLDIDIGSPIIRLLARIAKRPVERLLGFDDVNDIYHTLPQDERSFEARGLARMSVTWEADAEELERFPREGPVVAVANHPFGMLEGLILIELLRQVRPDTKVLANYILARYPEMLPGLILVDPFDSGAVKRRNLRGIREAMAWLRAGNLLGTFPAGEVAHLAWGKREIVDPPWSASVGRLIRTSQAQVVPLYLDGINGALFQLAGLVHPLLRTALIPREMLRRQGAAVQVRIGDAIDGLHRFTDEEIINRARDASYSLARDGGPGRIYTWKDVLVP